MWNRQQVLRVSLSLAALCLASGFPVLSMADSPQPVSGLNHQYQHFSFGGLAGLTSAYTHTNNGIFNATHTLAEPSPLYNLLSTHPTPLYQEREIMKLENRMSSKNSTTAQSEHRDLSAPIWQPLTDGVKLAQLASVCFITDAGNCSGAGTGSDLGGSSSSGPGPIEPDNEERCRLEGYTNQKCGTGQTSGSKCPYDGNWHSGCTCNPEYNKTCTGANEQGKGTTCDGKYKECCKKCTGYDYTASNIPAGYVKNGSCTGCSGTKYKIKCDTNTSNTGTYVDCGTAGGTGGTCSDDTGTYYKECTCPNMYEWSASSKKCVCSTGYKYTCTGSNISGGEGAACDNKYQKCVCQTGFTWDAASGMCVCNGTDWCTLNQDCAALGYKKQTCTSGTTLRCPFDITYVVCG